MRTSTAKKNVVKMPSAKKQKLLPPPDGENLPTGAKFEVNPQAIIEAAIKNRAPMDVLERMVALGERLQAQAAERAYHEAMAALQRKLPIIKKTKVVKNRDGSERYKYAPIESIVKQAGPVIAKHGFSYTFKPEQSEGKITSVCCVHHAGGHTEETRFSVDVKFDTITGVQATGAARTYTNRYALCNAFGIVTMDEDTDGLHEERVNEVITKIKALPEYIRKGFVLLGYKSQAAYQFCEDREWDEKRIKAEIDKLVAKQEK